jgi:hypothetical protein
LTIQEEAVLKLEVKSHSRNPILEGSSNKILKVKGAQVAVITNLAAAFGKRDLSSAASKHPGWILLTSELRDEKPELAAGWKECETRNTIFDILIMAPPSNQWTGFEYLWRPEGRGAVEDLDLIQWIDDKAWFSIGPWTLREWSQVKLQSRTDYKNQPLSRVDKSKFAFRSSKSIDEQFITPTPISREQYINHQSSLFIKVHHGVLSSGMRLACINLDERCPVAMVHPEAEVGDEIFYLEGCRIPVVLRRLTSIENDGGYKVIGACCLGIHISEEFVISKNPGENCSAWSRQLNPREIILH